MSSRFDLVSMAGNVSTRYPVRGVPGLFYSAVPLRGAWPVPGELATGKPGVELGNLSGGQIMATSDHAGLDPSLFPEPPERHGGKPGLLREAVHGDRRHRFQRDRRLTRV